LEAFGSSPINKEEGAMLKKQFSAAIVVVSILVVSNPAWSSVVGTWDIVGKVTMKVSAEGLGSNSARGSFYDEFLFNPDGTFEMIDWSGSWSLNGKGFIIELDPLGVESSFEDSLSSEGLDADVTLISASFIGKEGKDGSTIKGKFSMQLDIYVLNLGVSGRVSVKASFRGSRALGVVGEQNVSSGSSGEESVSSHKKSLSEAIVEKIHEAISAHGVKQGTP
jgi:hypothetical protein